MLKNGLSQLFRETTLTERELKTTIGNLRSKDFPEFSEENYEQINLLLQKYPDNYKSSAVIPTLFIAQK